MAARAVFCPLVAGRCLTASVQRHDYIHPRKADGCRRRQVRQRVDNGLEGLVVQTRRTRTHTLSEAGERFWQVLVVAGPVSSQTALKASCGNAVRPSRTDALA